MKRLALPIVVLFAFSAGWEALSRGLEIPAYLLPPPSAIGEAGWENGAALMKATGLTALGALLGLMVSACLGLLIALAFASSRTIKASFYPFAIFLQTVPIIAIAPLIVIWVGTGLQAIVLVSLIVSIFPIITASTTGLSRVDPQLLELFVVYRATRFQTFIKLRLPGALPYFITGLKTASGLAVIGAIIGEFFAGASDEKGLGTLILQWSGRLKTAELFAAVIASTLLGLAIFGGVSLVGELLLLQWRGREVEA